MKILITGGAGFVGTNLSLLLESKNHEVVILDDFSTGLRSNIPANIQYVEGSITDFSLVRDLARKVDAIVHLAARGSVPRSLKNPVLTQEVNFQGTLNVLEAARESGVHVVFSSSSSVYGSNTELPKTESQVLRPLTPYAASKMSAEAIMMAYGSSYQLPVTTLRFFNVFGPWQRPDHIYSAVIPKWVWSGITGKKIQVFGDGNQSRDFTHVTTVTQVIYSSITERVLSPEPINLALGNNISLNFLLEKLRKHFPRLEVEFLDSRPGDVYASQNNPSLLFKKFPNLKIEDFESSLDSTVNWLMEQHTRITGGPNVVD